MFEWMNLNWMKFWLKEVFYHVLWWNDGRQTFDRQHCPKNIQMCFNRVFFPLGENCTVFFASCYFFANRLFLRTLYAHLFIWHNCVAKISDICHQFKIQFHLSCRTFKICKDESVFGNCLKVIHTWAIQHVKFHTFAVVTINRISIFYATKR